MSIPVGSKGQADDRHMRVPVLPASVDRLLHAINDESLGYAEIARVIGESPSIALRVLGLANSAWSAPVTPIASLDMACGRLGLGVIRSVAMALVIAEVFNPAACPAFDSRRYWMSALLTAEAAFLIASDTPDLDPEQARTAGLLRTIGLLWLADSRSDATERALRRHKHEPLGTLDALLQAECGIGYLAAGEIVARHWQLPEGIVLAGFRDCDELPEEVERLADSVCCGVWIERELWAGEQDGREVDTEVAFPDARVQAVLGDIQGRMERLGQLADELCR